MKKNKALHIALLIGLASAIATYVIAQLLTMTLCQSSFSLAINICDIEKSFKFYAENIRGNLFAGFLAMGGFLLSLKTFIVITMKDNIYDTKEYKERVKSQNKGTEPTKGQIYKHLKELSDILVYAIFSCIVTAVLQLTYGLVPGKLSLLLNSFLPGYSTALLIYCLILIKSNLNHLFND